MKNEFASKPETITEQWPGEFEISSWQDVITAMPSPLMVVTGWKSNGKENACLHASSVLSGSGGEYFCIINSVYKSGHMYQSIKETGCCVLNFPSKDISDQCFKTIENNEFETDEITASGLTAEKSKSVNAPRIVECFLNVECEFLWEHELFPGSPFVTMALKAVRICMDSDHYDNKKLGRYGKTGYMYFVGSQQNPDNGEKICESFAAIELYK